MFHPVSLRALRRARAAPPRPDPRRLPEELLAAFTSTGRCPASNGPAKAVNMLIKKIKRISHGFRNLDNYRVRLLLSVDLDWRPCAGRLRLPPDQRPLTKLACVGPL